jgi:hypothetical protein
LRVEANTNNKFPKCGDHGSCINLNKKKKKKEKKKIVPRTVIIIITETKVTTLEKFRALGHVALHALECEFRS